MKYRNMVRNDDGTYNIVWFSSAGVYRKSPLNFQITLYSTDAHSSTIPGVPDTQTKSGSIDITNIDEDIVYSIELVVYTPGSGWSRQTKAKYTFTIYSKHSATPNILKITCENMSDVVYGAKLPIRTDLLTYSIGTTTTTIFDTNNKKSGQFTVEQLLPVYAIKASDYVTGQEGIAKSLTQWLAVIKGELWYSINYGLPLLDKIRNKAVYDAYIIETITSHPEVKTIKQFVSSVENNVYTYNCTIISIFDEEFNLNSQANI